MAMYENQAQVKPAVVAVRGLALPLMPAHDAARLGAALMHAGQKVGFALGSDRLWPEDRRAFYTALLANADDLIGLGRRLAGQPVGDGG